MKSKMPLAEIEFDELLLTEKRSTRSFYEEKFYKK